MARTTHRGAALLIEAATALQLAVKLSLGCKLQDEVNARRVVEVAVEAQDVWVPLVDEEHQPEHQSAISAWGLK